MTVNLKSFGTLIMGNTQSNGSIDINNNNIISKVHFANLNIAQQYTFNAGDYIRVVSATSDATSNGVGAGFGCLVIY